MKKLQGNAIAKVCVWIVLLAAAFGAGVFGVRTLLSFQSVASDSWQFGGRFCNALENRRLDLVEGIHLARELEVLEQRRKEGTAGPLAYADAEAIREQKEQVEERFSRENTSFRFRVLTDDGQTVLGTNLNEGESLVKAVEQVHYFSFDLRDESGNVYYEDPYLESETPENAAGTTSAPVKLVLEYGVPEDIEAGSVDDEFYQIWVAWMNERAFFDQYLTGFLNLGALVLLALICLLWTAGHRNGEEDIVLTWQEKIWFDL